jgi:hypothetical protein
MGRERTGLFEKKSIAMKLNITDLRAC